MNQIVELTERQRKHFLRIMNELRPPTHQSEYKGKTRLSAKTRSDLLRRGMKPQKMQ